MLYDSFDHEFLSSESFDMEENCFLDDLTEEDITACISNDEVLIDHGQSVKCNKPNYFTLEEYCFCFYFNHIFQNILNFNGTNAIKHYNIVIDH